MAARLPWCSPISSGRVWLEGNVRGAHGSGRSATAEASHSHDGRRHGYRRGADRTCDRPFRSDHAAPESATAPPTLAVGWRSPVCPRHRPPWTRYPLAPALRRSCLPANRLCRNHDRGHRWHQSGIAVWLLQGRRRQHRDEADRHPARVPLYLVRDRCNGRDRAEVDRPRVGARGAQLDDFCTRCPWRDADDQRQRICACCPRARRHVGARDRPTHHAEHPAPRCGDRHA